MTGRTEIELVLDRYLSEGAERVPDRVLDAALDQIDHTRQRRAWRAPWRHTTMLSNLKLLTAGAAVVAAVVLGGGLLVNRASVPPVGTSPAPTSSPPPAPTASASAAAAAFLPGSGRLDPGDYVTDLIHPAARFNLECCFEIATHDVGLLVISETGLNRFLVLQNPTQVVNPATEATQPLPDDLIHWLVAHPGLDASPAEQVTIGGLTGFQTEGMPRPNANFDASGQLALTDSPAVPPLYIESDQRFRIAVLDGPDGPVVVAVVARSDVFDEFNAKADAVVASLRFGE